MFQITWETTAAMMMMIADSHSFSLMRMNWKVKMKGTIQGVRTSQER